MATTTKNQIVKYKQVSYVANEDSCPLHGGKIRNVYTYGRYQDAEVRTFTRCNCALSVDCERAWAISAELKENGLESCGAKYHPNYTSAAGMAKFIVAYNQAR